MTVDRRARKREQTRQALLESALTLFANRGIYQPSLEEITARADLGKGTFYQYFPSREALIAALVGAGIDALLARLGPPPVGGGTAPGLLLDEHQAFFNERPEVLLLLHQARGWLKLPERRSAIQAEFARYIDGLAAHLGGESAHEDAVGLGGFIAGTLSFERILEIPSQSLRARTMRLCGLATRD
ncbi:MAG: TetR/AcrR family transcriptional regulator [Candidatus Delongbacteria bacterium]